MTTWNKVSVLCGEGDNVRTMRTEPSCLRLAFSQRASQRATLHTQRASGTLSPAWYRHVMSPHPWNFTLQAFSKPTRQPGSHRPRARRVCVRVFLALQIPNTKPSSASPPRHSHARGNLALFETYLGRRLPLPSFASFIFCSHFVFALSHSHSCPLIVHSTDTLSLSVKMRVAIVGSGFSGLSALWVSCAEFGLS